MDVGLSTPRGTPTGSVLARQATPGIGSQVSNEPAATWIFFDPSGNRLHFMCQME